MNFSYFPYDISASNLRPISHRLQNVFDPTNMDYHPAGPIVKFVTNFIDSFVEQIGFDHDLKIFAVLRDEDGAARRLQVTLKKDAANVAIPEIGPPLQEWDIFFAHGRLPESAVSGILKRTHHAGDITERGA